MRLFGALVSFCPKQEPNTHQLSGGCTWCGLHIYFIFVLIGDGCVKNISTAILHQLTAALFDKDFFRVGYLLMALSEAPEDAATLKNKALSWLSVEILASVPHDMKQNNDVGMRCIDNSGAIISFLSACLDSAAPPLQYLEKMRATGRYITDHFVPLGQGAVFLEKQEVMDAYENVVRISELHYGQLLAQCKTSVIIIPARGVDYSACIWAPHGNNCKYVVAIPLQNSKGPCKDTMVGEVVAVLLVNKACKDGVNIPVAGTPEVKRLRTTIPKIDIIGESNREAMLPGIIAARRALQVGRPAISEAGCYK